MFEVPAGGRRYRALELLVKQKRMAKTSPSPVWSGDDGIAEDDFLAENVRTHRSASARSVPRVSEFARRRTGEEEIAARHFVTPAIVKQRLRLASVSPKLHDVYAEDGMTLEQLMAFTVTADQARQEQVWDNVSRSQLDEPYQIRRHADGEHRPRLGPRAPNSSDSTPMNRPAAPSCATCSSTTMAAGCRIRAVARSSRHREAEGGGRDHCGRRLEVDRGGGRTSPMATPTACASLTAMPADLTEEERATLDALDAESDKIEADYQDADELPDEIDQRLGEIEAALSAFEARPLDLRSSRHRPRRRLRQHRCRRVAVGRSRLCAAGR